MKPLKLALVSDFILAVLYTLYVAGVGLNTSDFALTTYPWVSVGDIVFAFIYSAALFLIPFLIWVWWMTERNTILMGILGILFGSVIIGVAVKGWIQQGPISVVAVKDSASNNTLQGPICLGVLVAVVAVAFWGRSEINKRAAEAGSYEKTMSITQPTEAVVRYIKKNYDRSSRGNRDWAKTWLSQDPPTVVLSTWYLRYWENCLVMILLGIIPYMIIRWLILGGRTEKITVEIRLDNGGSLIHLSSEGKVGYEEAEKLANALVTLV